MGGTEVFGVQSSGEARRFALRADCETVGEGGSLLGID